MKVSATQLLKLNSIFRQIDGFFIAKTKNNVYDCELLSKSTNAIGFHLSMYFVNSSKKAVQLEIWVGQLTDTKASTIDDFLEDTVLTTTNSITIELSAKDNSALAKQRIIQFLQNA